MKNQKGFTLIELLAVIVVLAIIALIAVPIVLNIIEQARKGAAISSARSYIKATETYVLTGELNKKDTLEKNNKYNVTTSTTIDEKTYEAINNLVEIKGTKPNGSEDYIMLGDTYSVVEARLTINGYEILIKNEEVVSITKNGKTENIDNESITLNKTGGNVETGSTLQLIATVTGNGNKTVTWTSSDENVATVDSNGLVTGIKDGSVKITAKTSNGKSAIAALNIGKFLANNAQIGDYVAYDAGEWTETKDKPTSQGEFGGYTVGSNKSNTVEWCNNSNYTSVLKGWRVLKIENDQVYLVHAGISECYYHANKYSSESITILNNRATNTYLNTTYAESAHMLNYAEVLDITGNTGGTTDSLRYIGPSGTTNNSANYWLGRQASADALWYVNNTGQLNVSYDASFGIRPVIVLKEGIKTSGKITDIVGNENAWSLVAS